MVVPVKNRATIFSLVSSFKSNEIVILIVVVIFRIFHGKVSSLFQEFRWYYSIWRIALRCVRGDTKPEDLQPFLIRTYSKILIAFLFCLPHILFFHSWKHLHAITGSWILPPPWGCVGGG